MQRLLLHSDFVHQNSDMELRTSRLY